MYLTKKIYVGGNYDFNKITGTVELFKDGKPIQVDVSKLTYIEESAIYWRKANAVHSWFVENVQDGEDECKPHYVSFEQLTKLKQTCLDSIAILQNSPMVDKQIPVGWNSDGDIMDTIKVFDVGSAELPMMPTGGFFFGSANLDEWFLEDLQFTADEISKLDPDAEYEYCSSW